VNLKHPAVPKQIVIISCLLLALLAVAVFLALSAGSTGFGIGETIRVLAGKGASDSMLGPIIWRLRFPRALMAILVGATLSLGGLVFQALLRNPLAEPYILGISSGAGIGAIIGIIMGLSRFPGVSLAAFSGSMLTLVLLLFVSSGETLFRTHSLLLSGVMVNAFCGALIMFLISITQDSRLHNVLFWLMGDLSMSDMTQVGILAVLLIPCFAALFMLSNTMNLMLMGREMALSMGVRVRAVTVGLLLIASFSVSVTVAQCGPVGFVGLVMPHLLRLLMGPDHRRLVPACILGGGSYMVLCDLLARALPAQGEMPVGVITALIGAPLFIFLLKRSG